MRTVAGRPIRSVGAAIGIGSKREMLLCSPSAWRAPLAGSGKARENRGKTRCGCSMGSQRHLLSKWKCVSLLMKVYLLPIVSGASPVKGSFDGSVFVHGL